MVALCKGYLWVLGVLQSLCVITALWAASFLFADAGIDCCLSLAATKFAVPISHLVALCHYVLRGAIICVIIPLGCNQRSLGSQ